MAQADALTAHAGELAATVRAGDRTRYLAHLFAPEPVRPALSALAAYHLELQRITASAREAMAAEIRLKWWRDAIRGEGYGAVSGVPLVDALRAGMRRYLWPADTLCAVSEAAIHDLYADPFADTDAFDGYAGETEGALTQLAAMALAIDALGEPDGLAAARAAATASGHAGVALTATAALTSLEAGVAAGRTHMPASVWNAQVPTPLTEALEARTLPPEAGEAAKALAGHGVRALKALGTLAPSLPQAVQPAFIRALACGTTLHRAARTGRASAPGPLEGQWRLWRAARALQRTKAV